MGLREGLVVGFSVGVTEGSDGAVVGMFDGF